MDDFLTRHGFRVAVMKADAVPPERREGWVAQRVEEGADVLVYHPRLVQTGLDLVEFPTICWYETEVSAFQSTPNAPLLVAREPRCDRPRPMRLVRLVKPGLVENPSKAARRRSPRTLNVCGHLQAATMRRS